MHPKLKHFYPELLFGVHCMIRGSVPLMETALRCVRTDAHADPVAEGLQAYLEKHIPEEMHHADWVLEDLEVLGVRREDILKRIPSPAWAALVGSQYYWILHVHPVALLGYIAVLEGDPPSEAALEEAVLRTGLPREAFRTLFKHAALDPHHGEDLNTVLDELPLSPEHISLIGVSAMTTECLLDRAFEEVLPESGLLSRVPAASSAPRRKGSGRGKPHAMPKGIGG